METTADRSAIRKAPAHLWVVGTLATLWNGFACLDYVLTNLRHPAYIAQLPPEMIDYIDAFPAWTIIAWGAGVALALLGSLLLLGRSLWAAYCFAFSLLTLAATQFYNFATGWPESMNTPTNWIMNVVIWIVAVALLLYAIRMRTRKILR
ncbi:hypothetical protein [Novosphingobium sp. M1R2S20]|uniref:Membrane protein YphA (DoxX/SURF4 family) n=1 Tax=Novosphingobium rhizovicinum TaxID=3228928 RepID=A0ABV3RHV7_9SPHN